MNICAIIYLAALITEDTSLKAVKDVVQARWTWTISWLFIKDKQQTLLHIEVFTGLSLIHMKDCQLTPFSARQHQDDTE